MSPIATWTGTSVPSFAQCQSAIAQSGLIGYAKLDPGVKRMCVATSDGNIAFRYLVSALPAAVVADVTVLTPPS